MNKTVELVNEWGAFEAKYPGGSLEEFCRYYLVKQRERPHIKGKLVGGVVPMHADGLLLKLIGRIHKFNVMYANMALEGTGLNQIEEFGMMLTIQAHGDPKKTEIIYDNLFELSSGADMLNRLRKRGFISEHADPEDKRSKRIKLTAEGEAAIAKSLPRVSMMAQMMLHDMNEEDKRLCIQLLKDTEIKYSAIWQQHKGRTLEEVYALLVPEDKDANNTM